MQKPIRVAIIIGHWQNYGVETLNMNLYRYLDRDRVQFDFIVCETPESDIPSAEIERLGGRLHIVPSYSKLPRYEDALKKLFHSYRYRIVHCHMSTLCPLALRPAKQAGIPIRIAHCHTMAGKGEYAKNVAKYALRIFSNVYPTHYATSSWMAGEWLFGPRVSREEMYYLPVAREISAFRYNPKQRMQKRQELGVKGKYVIGHLGRFVPQKNHSFIVKMFSQYSKVNDDAFLLLAGDGPLVDKTLGMIDELGITDKVSYLGRRNDVPDLYQAMDCFVLPSLYEGVPGTGTEAQAAGLPFLFADTITDEARILPTSRRISLKDMNEWLRLLEESKDNQRVDTYDMMTKAGYNIKNAAEDITRYYERLWNGLRR